MYQSWGGERLYLLLCAIIVPVRGGAKAGMARVRRCCNERLGREQRFRERFRQRSRINCALVVDCEDVYRREVFPRTKDDVRSREWLDVVRKVSKEVGLKSVCTATKLYPCSSHQKV